IFSGYILTWLVMGPRLNAETAARGHITIVDFITGDLDGRWKRIIGIVSAVMILFCFVFYISSQFQAAGNALTSVLGINTTEAILIGAAVIVVYCLLGGFWAASITDTLQAGVMMLACILVPIAALKAGGGFANIQSGLQGAVPANYFSFTGGANNSASGAWGMAGIGAAMGLMGTGLGALGQPQLLNRIMAVKSQRARVQGALITIGWGSVIYLGLTVLALSVRAMSADLSWQVTPGGESLFFEAAEHFLPPVLAGIVIAAVLSAVMSTVDSLLLATASAVSHDMGVPHKSPKSALMVGRLSMIGVAVLAVVMTLYLPKDIFSRVLFAWVALGAAFGPTVLTRCLGWRVPGAYVLAAIVLGFAIAVKASAMPGYPADMMEKWGSWLVGLSILFIGKMQRSAKPA
ncbi:MAG: sodium/proline symporter, partial [Robiginitomaculum sp.]|nr:sodium/proline symporter [Robiginitomaculum sp.]